MHQFTFTSRVHKGSLLSTSCQHLLTLVFLMMAIPIDVRCHLTGISIYIALVISRRRQWHPTPVLLPGKSHGWRSLVGCRPWGREESDTTEQLHFPFSLSCIGEGNGNSPVFLPGESQGQGSLVGSHLWGRTESDMTEAT